MIIPITDLHTHLEGSFTIELVQKLATKYNDHPWHGLAAAGLAQKMAYRDFPGFIEAFMQGYRLLRKAEDWQQLTELTIESLLNCGVKHAEILYSPGVAFQKLGVPLKVIHKGIEAGIKQVPSMSLHFILDTVLNLGPEFMSRTLNEVLRNRPEWLGGFSVGGGDPNLNMQQYLGLFEQAQTAGLFVVAHAGEVDGPQNIHTLLQHTDIQRIAHGCALIHDEPLMEDVRRRKIGVDVCVSSNWFTGVVERTSDSPHEPLSVFLQKGIQASLCSDDPFFFNTNIQNEHDLVKQWISPAQHLDLIRNGWENAQIEENWRQHMLDSINHS